MKCLRIMIIATLWLIVLLSSCNSRKQSKIHLTECSKQLISLFLEKEGDDNNETIDSNHIILATYISPESDEVLMNILRGNPSSLHDDLLTYNSRYPFYFVGSTRYKGYDILVFTSECDYLIDYLIENGNKFNSLFWTVEDAWKGTYYLVSFNPFIEYDPECWDITIRTIDTTCTYIENSYLPQVTTDEINAILYQHKK